jgi:hypothetical protein
VYSWRIELGRGRADWTLNCLHTGALATCSVILSEECSSFPSLFSKIPFLCQLVCPHCVFHNRGDGWNLAIKSVTFAHVCYPARR